VYGAYNRRAYPHRHLSTIFQHLAPEAGESAGKVAGWQKVFQSAAKTAVAPLPVNRAELK
jgi:hypothetical protein